MKGYPKHLNTKQDLSAALEMDRQRTITYLQQALDGRAGWVLVGKIDNESDGISDETHRVVDMGDAEEGTHEWYQQEWGPLPGNAIDRMGITVEEAQGMIDETT